MSREITEGFDACFDEIGLGYDEMTNINDIADKVSSALSAIPFQINGNHIQKTSVEYFQLLQKKKP